MPNAKRTNANRFIINQLAFLSSRPNTPNLEPFGGHSAGIHQKYRRSIIHDFPVAVPIGTYSTNNASGFHVGKHPFYLAGTHVQVCGNLSRRGMSVSAQISQDSLLLEVEAFLIGNVGIGFPLMADECVQDFFQHEVDEGAAVGEAVLPGIDVQRRSIAFADHLVQRAPVLGIEQAGGAVGSHAGRTAFAVDVAGAFPEPGEVAAGEDRPEKHEAGSGGEEDLFHRFRNNVLDLGQM